LLNIYHDTGNIIRLRRGILTIAGLIVNARTFEAVFAPAAAIPHPISLRVNILSA
jgi:hypothetical protein